jgi:hypothetical protein
VLANDVPHLPPVRGENHRTVEALHFALGEHNKQKA